jgi:predicted NUDIX family phosphoesterase
MSKDNQKIIVVKKDILFGNDYFQGFKWDVEVGYERRILSNMEVMRRGDAETNPEFKQPIGYSVIFNDGKVVAYQRSSKGGEKRLHGKWAWGFGGHVEPSDNSNKNPMRDSTSRELHEELLFREAVITGPKVIGYINDDTNDVGKVHFGILYSFDVICDEILPKDSEIERIKLCTVAELEEMCSSPDFDVESWSRISMEPLRKLL